MPVWRNRRGARKGIRDQASGLGGKTINHLFAVLLLAVAAQMLYRTVSGD